MFGIISATRVPLAPPMPCSQAPNARRERVELGEGDRLPMHVNAGRVAKRATLSSNTSRIDAYSLTSISAGTPGG